jgi:flagellar hook-length control protein FliK
VNTALALKICEAPNTAAAATQASQAETGTKKTANPAESFKKKLEGCEAVVVPVQLVTTGGSNTNTEVGTQNGIGTKAPGMDCCIEGRDVSDHPMDVTVTCDTAAAFTDSMAAGEQAGRTPENAWMQYTTAGDNPAQTQDQILETIGVYMDAASEPGEQKPEKAVQQAPTAPTLVSTETPKTEAKTELSKNTAEAPVTPDTTAAEKPAAAVEASKAATPLAQEKTDATAALPTYEKADATAALPTPEKRDVELKNDPIQSQSVNAPAGETRETVPVAMDTVGETTTEKTVQHTRDNVLRIVDKVAVQSENGRYDFDVELKPDFMGKVHIKLTMEDGNIRMQIKTDDMSVKGMLMDQTSSLQNALKEKGITLTNVDVMYDGQTTQDFSRQPHEQNSSGRHGLYYGQASTMSSEPAEEHYGYYTGGSSMEFLA